MPGIASNAARTSSRSPPGASSSLPSQIARASATRVAPRDAGIPRPSNAAAASASGRGNATRSPAAAVGQRLTETRGDAAGDRTRGGDRDLLADDRAHRDLEPVERAGHAKAGRLRDERAQSSDRRRAPRRSRQGRRRGRRAAGTPASSCPVTGASESSISTSIALPDAGTCTDTTPMVPSMPDDAPVGIRRELLDAGNRALREEAEQRLARERRTVGEGVRASR